MKTFKKTQCEEIDIKYSYKSWWMNPKSKEKELTKYSKSFNTIEDAKFWYINYGLNIESIFNRTLVLTHGYVIVNQTN